MGGRNKSHLGQRQCLYWRICRRCCQREQHHSHQKYHQHAAKQRRAGYRRFGERQQTWLRRQRLLAALQRRYRPIDRSSEALFALKPVKFRYKQQVDPDRAERFGLIAEDVERINPDLVVRDTEGKPNTVRYESINALLLNEFLKEHHKVQGLEDKIAQQQKEMKVLTAQLKQQAAQIEKVTSQLEKGKPAVPVVATNP